MKHITFWLVLIFIAVGIQFVGRMSPKAKAAKKIEPASVSKIEGSDLKRLSLLPEAAKRLDIQTAPVREEIINPTQQVAGEVVKTDANSAVVRVELTDSEMSKVRREEPAFILPLARDSKARRIQAQPLSGLIAQTLSLDTRKRRLRALPANASSDAGETGMIGMLHYEVSGADHGLVNRELVFVELSLAGAGEKRKIIPFAAVMYDAKGNTWVYTNPEPLVFVRQPIKIDTIAGDEVLLAEGPPAGTPVVTVGGAELFGTEFGVGK
jgi:hypothetical protein